MNMTDLAITDIIRISFAILAGGMIGLEREFHDKAAGFRTLIFISIGSALFTILSANIAGTTGDATRIAAYVVSGIGFLGAGAILRDGNHVTGLTTAATIWLTAAIGMTMGMGDFIFGGLITIVALIVLWIFPVLEHAIDRIREETVYHLSIQNDLKKLESLDAIIKSYGVRVVSHQHYKEGSLIKCRWVTIGRPKSHEKFIQYMLADPEIVEFSY